MASVIRVGTWKFRINPDDARSLQRATMNSNNWSHVTGFNGHEILDLLPHGAEDLLVITDYANYVRRKSGLVEQV